MDEFKKFSIPVKWRKYIWLGVISFLLWVIKWLAAKNGQLEQDLKDCNKEKVMQYQNKGKSDSVMIELLMRRALDRASENIIQPKIDSLKANRG